MPGNAFLRSNLQRGEKVLTAFSGGLDSAAAVLLLREAGYRPRALFLDLLDSPEARQTAVDTAEMLGVELIVEPCASLFQTAIVDPWLAEHAAGRTPAPCSRCNPQIKWRLLTEAADRLGIYRIATGHYVRTVLHGDGHCYFRRGVDPAKDQSYYLWNVPEPWIARAVLPLGDFTKAEVRDMLRDRYGLTELVERKESMGICFLEGRKYGEFLRSRLPAGLCRPGEVVTLTGEVVGRHEGYPLYTAAQKRGFSLFECSEPASYAVVGIDAARNRVIVGPDEAMHYRTLLLKEWRVVSRTELRERAREVRVVVRGVGRNPDGGCRMKMLDDGRLEVFLLQDTAWAVMPGQPVVFYLDDRVVGGGILDAAHRG